MIGKQILSYKVLSLIGEGGMGNVYLAEHAHLGRKVAIKMLHPRLASNESLRKRFLNEASAMAHLQHPNIVGLLDYVESDEGLFLIMEYVQGEELDIHIRAVSGPIEEKKAKALMMEILDAFDYAHKQGIVHRDIKPSNILMTQQGGVKVLDFGIAKMMDDDKSMTKTGTQIGTVLYMSPEQVKGEKVDARTDIYSLGVTLFQMITGRSPYSGNSAEYEVYTQIVKEPLPKASSVYPGVSVGIESVIHKATQKRREDRFQTCQEMIRALKIGKVSDALSAKQQKNENQSWVKEKVFATGNSELYDELDSANQTPVRKTPIVKEKLSNSGVILTCGIIGLVLSWNLIGLILNIITVSLASSALSRYKNNPEKYTESSFSNSKTGQLFGIIGMIIFGILLFVSVANK
ncbi:MAG: serine/threonine-protein kinase [Crocinitomix sp.]|nr:serine/threonine-protein kinase [Crocinitomix sp.]